MLFTTTTEWNLSKRRQRLLREMRELLRQNVMRGTIVETSRTCGRRNCVCMREGKRHARMALSVNMDGKTRSVHLSSKRQAIAHAATANYRKLWQLLEELTEVNLKLLALKQPPSPGGSA